MPPNNAPARETDTEQVPGILARALVVLARYPSGRIIETSWSERTQMLQLVVDTVPGALHLFARLTRLPVADLPEPRITPEGFVTWAGDVRSGASAYVLAVGAPVRTGSAR